jgi:hypothetical protein
MGRPDAGDRIRLDRRFLSEAMMTIFCAANAHVAHVAEGDFTA